MDRTQLVVRYNHGRWTLGRSNYAYLAFPTKQRAVEFARILAQRLEGGAALRVQPKSAARHR